MNAFIPFQGSLPFSQPKMYRTPDLEDAQFIRDFCVGSCSCFDLDIHIRETVTPRLIEELSDGRLDCAILALPIDEPALIETPLFTEELLLVRPEADADKPVPKTDELREMRLLMLEEGHCFRDQALSFCNMPTARPREGLDGSSLATLVQMVGAGIGVTLIPEMAAPVETKSAPVCVAPFAHPRPSRSIGMIWRKTTPLADGLKEIAALVKASAATNA
jgi:LysR family hydrogen peroxide-inducible transcriptional activator